MSYDIKYDDITTVYFTLNQITGESSECLTSVIKSLDTMIQKDSFKGKTAENMKNYMNEVSKTLVASAIMVLSELSTEFLLYKDGYAKNIDSDLHFRIKEDKLEALETGLKNSQGTFDDVDSRATEAINAISDLVSLPSTNSSDLAETYSQSISTVNKLKTDVGTYETDHVSKDFTLFYEMLNSLNSLIKEYAGKVNAPGGYTSMDIAKSHSFFDLGNALQKSMDNREALADQIAGASEREKARYEALVAEWSKERAERGWLETVTGILQVVGGVFVIVGSVAAAPFTGGISLVGTVPGALMIANGRSDIIEGIQDIYYGYNNNPFDPAFNPIRDTIFSAIWGKEGKQKAYDYYSMGCSIVGTVCSLGFSGWAAGAQGGAKAVGQFALKAGVTMVAGAGSGYIAHEAALYFGASETVADTIGAVTATVAAFATAKAVKTWNPEGGRTPQISQEKIQEIVSTPKGVRPDPSTYLSQDYIDNHLADFKDGATKIVATTPTGTAGPPNGTYVMPSSVADDLIVQAGGDVAKLEQSLGLPKGSLGNNPVRVDIPDPTGLRMPSGNEMGANNQWIPGGYTSGGIPEAVINSPTIEQYVINPIK